MQTSPAEITRQQNRASVLTLIQEQGPISRVELARLLGLNPATITRITRDLIEGGLVQESGEGETKGAGRKRILLHFNHGARLVIGIHVNERQATGVITNLASDILTRRTVLAPNLNVKILSQLIEELLEDDPSFAKHLSCICISVSDTAEDTQAISTQLQADFASPVVIVNAHSSAAIAEANFGHMVSEPVFVIFNLGAVSRMCTYIGGNTRVGQLGFSQTGQSLTLALSDEGLVLRFKAAHQSGTPSALSITDKLRARHIFEAARHGDPAASQAIDEIVAQLEFSVMWITNALALQSVIFAGNWLQAADILLPLLEQKLKSWGEIRPRLLTSKLGEEAALIGAVTTAIQLAEPT